MKQKVRQVVKDLDLYNETPVAQLIAELSEALEKHDDILTFAIRDDPYCEGDHYLTIYLDRYETDEEYNARLLKEKIDLLKKQREEISNKEKRFRQYMKLKEEFESETKD